MINLFIQLDCYLPEVPDLERIFQMTEDLFYSSHVSLASEGDGES